MERKHLPRKIAVRGLSHSGIVTVSGAGRASASASGTSEMTSRSALVLTEFVRQLIQISIGRAARHNEYYGRTLANCGDGAMAKIRRRVGDRLI